MTSSKVRLYDLAKELKLDTKRLIEDVRREGVDVSVPSNSVSKELADKIRNKYFPKKEASAPRAVRVVKKAARPTEELHLDEIVEAPAEAEVDEAPAPEPVVEAAPAAPAPTPAEVPPVAEQPTVRPMTPRVIKKLTPAARAEQPAPEVPEGPGPVPVAPVIEAEPEAVETVPEPQPAPQTETPGAVAAQPAVQEESVIETTTKPAPAPQQPAQPVAP